MKQDIEQTEFIKNCQLIDNTYYRYVSDDFQFEYGAINVVPRFHLDRKIKEEFIQFKAVVATSLVLKRNSAKGDLIYEYQILHRDEKNGFKTECAKFPLYDYTIIIKHIGDAQIQI